MSDPDLLVIDEETSGLFLFKERSAHPRQPRVATMGWIFATPQGQPVKVWYGMFKPDGWSLTPQLEAYIHTTNAELHAYGHAPATVLANLFGLISKWRRPLMVVGHNISFDIKGVKVEAERANLRPLYDEIFADLPTFCTMKAAAPVVNLPPTPKMVAAGFTKPKSPKLEEAYAFFNEGRPPKSAHNALADCFSCLDVFLALKKQGVSVAARPARLAESAVEEIA